MKKHLVLLLIFLLLSNCILAQEGERICPKCNKTYPYEANFCTLDGEKLVTTGVILMCPKCGKIGGTGESFCSVDGEKLVPAGKEQEEQRAAAIEHYLEGNKLSDQKDYDQALEEYLKALALFPGLAELHYNMAWVYEKLGSLEEAVKHLREYIRLKPEAEDLGEVLSYATVIEKGIKEGRKMKETLKHREEIIKEVLVKNRDRWDMVLIPAGEFPMGTDDQRDDCAPRHNVYLDAFYIDRYEVTNAQYYEFLEYIKNTGDHSKCHKNEPAGKNHTPREWEDNYYDNPDFPVARIDWYDAYAYAAWAGKRLPTEAEWEKAARGPKGNNFPWGDLWLPEKCNIGEEPKPVGSYEEGKSPYGCYDMAGSVAEWVADWYDPYYYQSSPSTNPQGPEGSIRRVIRGGSRFGRGFLLRATIRKSEQPNVHNQAVGFRCAKSPS